jgi:uncharacterized protein YfaS (alpha-2-macroglobulin family)
MAVKNKIKMVFRYLLVGATTFLGISLLARTTPNLIKKMEPYNYEEAWKKVEENDQKALPQSALKIVNEIYKHAKEEKNTGQQVKAIIHQMKFADYKEDDAFVLNLDRIKEELKTAAFPVKPLLHSMLAEMYWQYYESNRWKFGQRSALSEEVEQNDIQTWSLDKIVQETMTHYEASLKDKEKLQSGALKEYDEILSNGNADGRKIRATLYDFLAYRAIDFYSGDEPNITKPAYAFTLDQPAYLEEVGTFVKQKIESRDTLSMKFYALVHLQDLLKFHQHDQNQEALVYADLRRLSFVYEHLTVPGKTNLYETALRKLETQAIKNPVSTLVTLELAELYQVRASEYKPLESDKHKWDLKKAYELCDSAKLRFPNSLGAIRAQKLQEEITAKNLSSTIEAVNLPNTPFRALVRYKNVSNLYWKIVKTSREEVGAQRKKWERNYQVDSEEKFLEHFAPKTPVAKGMYKLIDDGDYQTHTTEIKIDGVPEGEYMLLLSHDPNFKTTKNALAYAFTYVTKISYISRNTSEGTTELYVLNRLTGEALSGVQVKLSFQQYNYKKSSYELEDGGTYTTDAQGYVKIPYQLDKNNSYSRNFSLTFVSGKDLYSTISIDDRYYNGTIYQYKETEPRAFNKILFFTDRAIYRPGQTVYFKGLLLEVKGKVNSIIPKQKVTVVFYDVNRQQIATETFTTNEFGSLGGTFTAPSSGLMGSMTLEAVGFEGSSSVLVEEYKRPKFEVGFDPIKGSFRLNEAIEVEGFGKTYSGVAVDGAQVQYRIVRNARYPFWWWCRFGYYPSSPEVEIISGATRTDDNGKFAITFNALPDPTVDPTSEPTFTYTITADVTDINGETHSRSTTVSVGYKALMLGLGLPKELDKEDNDAWKKEVEIRTLNLSGVFEPAKGQITLYRLKQSEKAYRTRLWERPDKPLFSKEEFHKLFPEDEYQEENNFLKWERDQQVLKVDFDTEKHKTFSIESLKNKPAGYYLAEITSKDKYGSDVKEVVYFSTYSNKSKQLVTPAIVSLKEVRISGEPGEKALLMAGTSLDKIKVLYEIEKEGTILHKEWLTLKNEIRVLEIPLKEEYRGNIAVHYTFISNNRLYTRSVVIVVPHSDKQLNISIESFRNKLEPGQQEEWKVKISGKKSDKVSAELVAGMYDASLDAFVSHSWSVYFNSYAHGSLGWSSMKGFGTSALQVYTRELNPVSNISEQAPYYDRLNWFGYHFRIYERQYFKRSRNASMRETVQEESMMLSNGLMDMAEAPAIAMSESEVAADDALVQKAKKEAPQATGSAQEDFGDVKVRSNFNETAFFYPQLQTNAEGDIIIRFQIPEALTRWKLQGFAHTKDLKTGYITNELVTQKELMVVPNQPRFFRENDKMVFAAKLTSLSDNLLTGQAQLEFFDALTMKPVNDKLQNKVAVQPFSVKAGQSTNLEWTIEIPEGIQALMYRIVAKAGTFSDGEEMVLPVVTNRMLVTESLPLPIRGAQTKTFELSKLLNNNSSTLKSHRYTLEYTSNPAWYAVQALPYLMEYPYECAEQVFSRYYANSIASHIAQSNPRIRQVFDTWKNVQPDALLSNLEKNQELKSALLEETPWVLQAQNETQRKRMVGLLFDLNRMADEQGRALEKLLKAQTASGGFTWFPGLPEDRYMTQHIAIGMARLNLLGVTSVRTHEATWSMVKNALAFADAQMAEDYRRLKELSKKNNLKLEDQHLNYINIQYLYLRSFYKDQPLNKNYQEAFNYYLGQAQKYWTKQSLYMQGMLCLVMHRYDDKKTAQNMLKSFDERALHSEEMGTYWKLESGYYWYQAPIETQALMIEVYEDVAANQARVNDLKVWLLKQKQTQDWKTTRATVEACYALLRRGTDFLTSTELVEVKVGDQIVNPADRPDVKVEAGTGYFKTAWTAPEIDKSMGKITVTKKDEGVAWGAVYWQYFEQLDKITSAETGLKINKKLFVQQNTDRGPVLKPVDKTTALQVGDLVKVRIEIRVDRNMEYVHLKDMRAAAFEPVSTLSTYRHQDGLWYYESPRDLAMNFFIGYLPKGTYVFEYPLRVSQKGDFSNGITTMQCMYAPEFTSHSEGVRVNVK